MVPNCPIGTATARSRGPLGGRCRCLYNLADRKQVIWRAGQPAGRRRDVASLVPNSARGFSARARTRQNPGLSVACWSSGHEALGPTSGSYCGQETAREPGTGGPDRKRKKAGCRPASCRRRPSSAPASSARLVPTPSRSVSPALQPDRPPGSTAPPGGRPSAAGSARRSPPRARRSRAHPRRRSGSRPPPSPGRPRTSPSRPP